MEDEKIINKNLQAEINNTIHRNILPEEQEGINQKIEDASIINSDEETSSERKRNKAKSDTSSDYSWSGSDHKSVDQIPNKAKKDLGCFKCWKEMFLNEDVSIVNSNDEISSERKRNKAKSDTSSDYSWSGSDHKSVDQIPNKAKKDLGCFKRWKEMFLNEDSNLDKKISKSFRC